VKRDLRAELLERVDGQLADGEPPAASAAFLRLQREGKSKAEARRLLAAALLAEMHAMARDDRPFDGAGYAQALEALPRILKR
jgi:hypothetical protein